MSKEKDRDQWNSKEKIAAEFLKHKTKGDIAGANKEEVKDENGKSYEPKRYTNEGCQSAYQAARRLGILDEVSAHMQKPKRGRKKSSKKAVEASVATATETQAPKEHTV